MTSLNINFVYGAVLAAALFHALWNALVKHSPDTLLGATGIAACGALCAALALPWLQQPSPASWPYLSASLALQVVYMRLLAHIYQVSDMSVAYPLMRGTAPLLVALVSPLLSGDILDAMAITGICTICAGILCIGLPARLSVPARRGARLALVNALFITGYTLVDGLGVRLSNAPAGYTLWEFMLLGIVLPSSTLRGRTRRWLEYMRQHWRAALLGGIGSVISYGVALWAMTLAPIAIIAALRETSILFGMLLSGLFLHERMTALRVLGACILVSGIIVLRLAT